MASISFGTASVLGLCIALWVLPSLLGANGSLQGRTCQQPFLVVQRLQLWRVWFSTVVHGGFFHILFNMIAWYFLAADYESNVGSLALLYDVFMRLVPFSTFLHIVGAYLFDGVLSTNLRHECAVGLSGVLFALLVIQLRYETSVSVFGFFDMPAIWYPPALALMLQLFSPNLSLMGHLSGILAGHALNTSMLDWAKLPTSTNEWLELRLKSLPRWQFAPGYLSFLARPDPPSFQATVSNARTSVSQWWSNSTAAAATNQSTSSATPGDSRPGRAINTSSTNAAAFTGTGHVVGGATTPRSTRSDDVSPRTGVPSHSRLLQQPPKVAKKFVPVPHPRDTDEDDTDSNV